MRWQGGTGLLACRGHAFAHFSAAKSRGVGAERAYGHTLLLRRSEGGSHFGEDLQVLVDVLVSVLHRDGPLLVPPVRLREDAAVGHGKPVVGPDVLVDVVPVAIIADA